MSADAYPAAGWTGRVMQALNAVWTLVLVNLLFAGGVLAGLVVAGVMPAGVAAASVLLPGGPSAGDGLVRAFARQYRASFRRASLTGIPFLIAGLLLAADAMVLSRLDGPAAAGLSALTAVVALVVIVALAVTVTLLTRHDDRPAAVLRAAVAVALAAPLTGLGVLLTLLATAVIAAVLPVTIPLVGVSLPLAIAVRLIDRRLARLPLGASQPILDSASDPHHPDKEIL
ncbi:DUF624 domain-containing protein [Microbacterium sp. NPDC089987]|uniref:DUF624 domain-containing protein n=1 Tax=Microbacterium sp. NPDC089987 TaxID=3364202 RepID=UPI003829F4D4